MVWCQYLYYRSSYFETNFFYAVTKNRANSLFNVTGVPVMTSSERRVCVELSRVSHLLVEFLQHRVRGLLQFEAQPLLQLREGSERRAGDPHVRESSHLLRQVPQRPQERAALRQLAPPQPLVALQRGEAVPERLVEGAERRSGDVRHALGLRSGLDGTVNIVLTKSESLSKILHYFSAQNQKALPVSTSDICCLY